MRVQWAELSDGSKVRAWVVPRPGDVDLGVPSCSAQSRFLPRHLQVRTACPIHTHMHTHTCVHTCQAHILTHTCKQISRCQGSTSGSAINFRIKVSARLLGRLMRPLPRQISSSLRPQQEEQPAGHCGREGRSHRDLQVAASVRGVQKPALKPALQDQLCPSITSPGGSTVPGGWCPAGPPVP